MSKWYSLDNAAKIFPPSKSKKDPKIFRFSVTLFDEVKVDVLNKALNETLDDGTILTEEFMKSDNFLNMLGSEYVKDNSGKNNGYPMLKWQK